MYARGMTREENITSKLTAIGDDLRESLQHVFKGRPVDTVEAKNLIASRLRSKWGPFIREEEIDGIDVTLVPDGNGRETEIVLGEALLRP